MRAHLTHHVALRCTHSPNFATRLKLGYFYTWIDANIPYYGTYTYTRVRGIGARDSWDKASLSAKVVPIFRKRCLDCHERTAFNPALYGGEAKLSSKIWTDRGITAHGFPSRYPLSGLIGPELRINLTHPKNSLLLAAPLSKEAGGLGLCRGADTPFVFKDKDDPDYQTILATIAISSDRLKTYPRIDMPAGYEAYRDAPAPSATAVRRSSVAVPTIKRVIPVIKKSVGTRILTQLPDGVVNLASDAKATSRDGLPVETPNRDDPRSAIDGNPETYWDDIDNGPLYALEITFDAPRQVSAISIVGWKHHNFSPRDFAIACDGKIIGTVKNAKYTENRLIVAFAPTKCRKLELQITAPYLGSPAIRELGAYFLSPRKDSP